MDPITGNLYVADAGDHRVLRFPSPFQNLSRIEPDAVLGSEILLHARRTPRGVRQARMNSPRGVALTHRQSVGGGFCKRSPVSCGNFGQPRLTRSPTVIGQKAFSSLPANGGSGVSVSGFDGPWGIGFDTQDNLYVAAYNNTRVLRFAAPLDPKTGAAPLFFGEPDLTRAAFPGKSSVSKLMDLAASLWIEAGKFTSRCRTVIMYGSCGG